MTSEQLCSSAVALFWVALERQDESRRNNSEKRIFAAGQGALMQDTELPGVCLRWMRQANSQAAAIREQEGFGKRKGADGGGAVAQKRPRPSAPFAPPIAGSPSTSTSTTWYLSDMCNYYYELSIQRSGFEWHYLYSDASPFPL